MWTCGTNDVAFGTPLWIVGASELYIAKFCTASTNATEAAIPPDAKISFSSAFSVYLGGE